jgi:hypothetical protein
MEIIKFDIEKQYDDDENVTRIKLTLYFEYGQIELESFNLLYMTSKNWLSIANHNVDLDISDNYICPKKIIKICSGDDICIICEKTTLRFDKKKVNIFLKKYLKNDTINSHSIYNLQHDHIVSQNTIFLHHKSALFYTAAFHLHFL